MRFSGMPQRPKPPMRMVMPFFRFAMAASGEEMRLSMGEGSEKRLGECTAVGRWAGRMAQFPDWPLGETPRGKEGFGVHPGCFSQRVRNPLKTEEIFFALCKESERVSKESRKRRALPYTPPGRLYEYQKKGVVDRGVCKSMKISWIAPR